MEYFDVCDKNGLPTGEVIEREEAHRLGIRHRTAHVWIARNLPRSAKQLGSSSVEQPDSSPTGQPFPLPGKYTVNDVEILMQKRSLNKDSYPGMYDTSSAGHIPAGCEPLESALRELQEELGLDVLVHMLVQELGVEAQWRLLKLRMHCVYLRVRTEQSKLGHELVTFVLWADVRPLETVFDRPRYLAAIGGAPIALERVDGEATSLYLVKRKQDARDNDGLLTIAKSTITIQVLMQLLGVGDDLLGGLLLIWHLVQHVAGVVLHDVHG